MLVCDLCGKTATIGRQGRHHKGVAGGKWKKRAPRTVRVFMPNLHTATIGGVKMKLCSKCLRTLKGKKSKASARRERKMKAAAAA